ncbi:MAG TPA: TrkA family potassium uptake protein [Herpetosiphonaceae bacterium]
MAEKRRARRGRRRRVALAALRDAGLIMRDSWGWLAALLLAWFGFAWLIMRFYDVLPQRLGFQQALYVAFKQMTLNPEPPPRQLAMQLAFYLAPAVNLFLIGRGALNIGLFVFDKRNRREAWQMALASTYRDHIIVCGLGKIGFRVVNQLIGDGHEVVAIDSRQEGPFNELVQGRKVPVLIGDARQPELLEQAGVRRARSITVVTSDDLTNLDIALTARELRPELHIVMRVFNDSLGGKLASAFGIKTAFSTSALAAPTLAAAAVGKGITNALYVGGKLLSTVELTVARDGVLDNRLVRTIEDQRDVTILYWRNRDGEDLRPRGDFRLSAGDTIVIIGELAALSAIQEQNRERAAPHSPIRRNGGDPDAV